MNKPAPYPTLDQSRPGGAKYEELRQKALALVDGFAARAEQAETLRNLPPENIRDLHASGLFRMLQPARIGGAELDYGCLVDMGAIIARGCASTAWTMTNLASHHWMVAMFPEETQDRVWGEDPDALIASAFIFPAGKARPAPGGYRLSGRWAFSSGVDPSAWNLVGGVVEAADGGAPHSRVFLLHRSQYEIIDTWHATGLKGTGSNDILVNDIFVPEAMTVAADHLKGGATPGSAKNPSALYRLPVFALFPLILSGIALGLAEVGYKTYAGSIRERASKFTGARLAELQSTQIKIGNIETRIDLARRAMLGICTDAMEDARQGRIPDLETRMRYRRDVCFATNLCIEAVDLVNGGFGAESLYTNRPMQRYFRDAHAVGSHIAFNMDAASSAHGRVAIGVDTTHPTI
jgi:3-hydroxy-9,10-secoandrosta-1,3,5(10)-triene-9,17-dione monooxygenase